MSIFIKDPLILSSNSQLIFQMYTYVAKENRLEWREALMKKTGRVNISTHPDLLAELETRLHKKGMTLTDWFEDKALEELHEEANIGPRYSGRWTTARLKYICDFASKFVPVIEGDPEKFEKLVSRKTLAALKMLATVPKLVIAFIFGSSAVSWQLLRRAEAERFRLPGYVGEHHLSSPELWALACALFCIIVAVYKYCPRNFVSQTIGIVLALSLSVNINFAMAESLHPMPQDGGRLNQEACVEHAEHFALVRIRNGGLECHAFPPTEALNLDSNGVVIFPQLQK